MYALRNSATGVVHKIDDDGLQELAACLRHAREQGRTVVFFRSMRVEVDVAAKIIHDSI